MTDPAGGREAEIEAVARRLIESYSYFEPSDNDIAWRVARTAIAALDAVRGTGSAARNQEDEDEVERLRRELAICREDRAFKHRQVETLAKRADAARSPQSEDPMPVFVIKAKDNLAVAAVEAYRALCVRHDLLEQAHHVEDARDEIVEWRLAHPDQCKWPDHAHVPAARSPQSEDHEPDERPE